MEARTLEPVAFEEREDGRWKRLATLGSEGRWKSEEDRREMTEERREREAKEKRGEIPAKENQLGLRRWSLGGD
jgi:hypothetical protein